MQGRDILTCPKVQHPGVGATVSGAWNLGSNDVGQVVPNLFKVSGSLGEG